MMIFFILIASYFMNNDVVYQAKLHWVIFVSPLCLFVLSLAAAIKFPQIQPMIFLLSFFAFAWIAITWAIYHFSSLTIKTRQVILRTGMMVRKTIDIPLNKIESIDISQPLTGSILGFGSLVITGTGGTKHIINHLSHPLTCRRHIEQLIHQ